MTDNFQLVGIHYDGVVGVPLLSTNSIKSLNFVKTRYLIKYANYLILTLSLHVGFAQYPKTKTT